MSAPTNDGGGAAFPATKEHGCNSGWSGMTLRDYLAAKAMQSQMLNEKEMEYWAQEYSMEEMYAFAAERAYTMADAMLKARSE